MSDARPSLKTPVQFVGHGYRDCGEHRTTGQRAWCFDRSEWCYEGLPCHGCLRPRLRDFVAAFDRYRTSIDRTSGSGDWKALCALREAIGDAI